MKKILALILSILLVFGLAGCGAASDAAVTQDESDLTMYIGLGLTNSDYYSKLHEAILSETGIDVRYVYTNTLDTTNAMVSMLENYDLPADIIVTASFSPEEAQKNSLLDLAAYTNVPDLFTATKIQSVAIEGSIYQLPFATRLIGIEYNKTLLNEMGWQLPTSFNEMLELKAKADAAGVKFAVSGGIATGHGFNYLMYVMGTNYIATPDGTQWFNDFIEGKTGIDEFASEIDYFKDYVESGLFGELYDSGWNSAESFKNQRALFYYNITNDAKSEDGGDEYASMPWISESGSCNCFANYESMYIGLDKKLSNPDQADKLAKAVKVLEFMTSDKAISIFTEMMPDGYVSTRSFTMDSSRMYADCSDSVSGGYTMPWYYNYFDNGSIMAVGQLVNDYIKGVNDVSCEEIVNTLEQKYSEHLNDSDSNSVYVEAEFGYEDCARLQAAAAGISMQHVFDENGIEGNLAAAIMPYIDSVLDIPLAQKTAVVQQKLYAGDFSYDLASSIIGSACSKSIAISMSGAEIKALADKGYNALEDHETDVTFKYALVVKNSATLKDEESYIVVIPEGALTGSDYQSMLDSGKVIMQGDKALSCSTLDGLLEIIKGHESLRPGNYWMK